MSGVTRVELPSGGWIALKDPRHVTIRARRPILPLMVKLSDLGESGELEIIDDILAVGGGALIAQWSFPEPAVATSIPDVITVEDAEALIKVMLPLLNKMVPDLSPDEVADPESPTDA